GRQRVAHRRANDREVRASVRRKLTLCSPCELLSSSKNQGASSCQRKSVCDMAGTVVDRHPLKIERTHPLKACDIDTVLPGIRTALMMGVDATARAEVMLCGVGVELVKREQFAAPSNVDAIQIRGHRNRPAHATVRTRTTPRRTKPIGQPCSE